MVRFDDYANKYTHIHMEQREGILQMRLHTEGETLRWGEAPHTELGPCFYDVGSDPNEDAVYVLESSRNNCVRIPIKKDGTCGKPEIYASGFSAIPDGMAFDVERNLYVTLPGVPKDGKLAPKNQIIRIDPNGKWELLIDDPDGTKLAFPTNCAFGGPGLQDLFLANLEGDHFSRVRLSVRGTPALSPTIMVVLVAINRESEQGRRV